MSPIQFQKRLRLQEARRLMLIEDFDSTIATYEVGYNDVAHFSREYKSLFVDPQICEYSDCVEKHRGIASFHLR